MDACGLSCQWLHTLLASHPQAHLGGVCVLFRGSALLLLQTLPLSHLSRLCDALTHWLSHILLWLSPLPPTFMIISPSPRLAIRTCTPRSIFVPHLLLFFGMLISLINSFTFYFFFLLLLLLEKGWRKSHLHYCPPCFSCPQETCLSQHQWSCGPVTHWIWV